MKVGKKGGTKRKGESGGSDGAEKLSNQREEVLFARDREREKGERKKAPTVAGDKQNARGARPLGKKKTVWKTEKKENIPGEGRTGGDALKKKKKKTIPRRGGRKSRNRGCFVRKTGEGKGGSLGRKGKRNTKLQSFACTQRSVGGKKNVSLSSMGTRSLKKEKRKREGDGREEEANLSFQRGNHGKGGRQPDPHQNDEGKERNLGGREGRVLTLIYCQKGNQRLDISSPPWFVRWASEERKKSPQGEEERNLVDDL